MGVDSNVVDYVELLSRVIRPPVTLLSPFTSVNLCRRVHMNLTAVKSFGDAIVTHSVSCVTMTSLRGNADKNETVETYLIPMLFT